MKRVYVQQSLKYRSETGVTHFARAPGFYNLPLDVATKAVKDEKACWATDDNKALAQDAEMPEDAPKLRRRRS